MVWGVASNNFDFSNWKSLLSEMSIPKKHHYLPKFLMQRWANSENLVTEYRRPYGQLVAKSKHPNQTGYLHELYANENRVDPVERQALEMVFMQKVDSRAAEALIYLDDKKKKPDDPILRDAWSRFLMSLMHRSPERVKYLTEMVIKYEEGTLDPGLHEKYLEIRAVDDPETYDDWLAEQGSITADLRVRLLEMII